MYKFHNRRQRARAYRRVLAVDPACVVSSFLTSENDARDREHLDQMRSVFTIDQILAGTAPPIADDLSADPVADDGTDRVLMFPGGASMPVRVSQSEPDSPALQIAPFATRRIDDSSVGRNLHRRVQGRLDPWITMLARSLRLSSMWVTSIATAFAFAFAALLFQDEVALAAAALTISGFFELIDAAVAKGDAKNPRGAVFLDYVMDRFSDIAIFGGVALAFRSMYPAVAYLSLTTLLLAMVGSYARAQALALRFPTRTVGLGRFERFAVIVAGVWFAAVVPDRNAWFLGVAVTITSVLTGITLIQRMVVPLSETTTEFSVSWAPGEYLPLLVSEIVDIEDLSLVVCDTNDTGQARHVVEADAVALFQPDNGRSKITLLRHKVRVNLGPSDGSGSDAANG
jgi:phosphatidylglycerophosphate synthase